MKSSLPSSAPSILENARQHSHNLPNNLNPNPNQNPNQNAIYLDVDAKKPADLRHLRKLLDQQVVTSEALTGMYLARIQQHMDYNAFIDVQADYSLEQAVQADKRIARGESMPLLGIPIAHKDVFVTQKWRTTAGSKMLENHISPFDATVVNRLSTVGMVCLGKTNMDEFAMGSSNEHSYFGAVDHPLHREYIPGGSSGGSAVAVALNLAPAATGSDTGGSIRQPAAFCGITGIKPTYGSVSRYGMIAYASSLDQAGVMAHTAYDCAMLLEAMVGMDDYDSTCIGHPKPNFCSVLEQLEADLKQEKRVIAGLKIGVPKEFMHIEHHEGAADNSESVMRIREQLQTFVEQGAQLIEVSLPHTAYTVPAYYVIAPAEAASNLARFDGVRYGYRAPEYKDLASMYQQTRSQGFGKEVKKRILVGAYVLSSNYYDAFYLKAQKLRRLIAEDFIAAFKLCDVIAAPVSPVPAWKKGQNMSEQDVYLADMFTLGASLAGLPAMSLPIGALSAEQNHMPVGMQLIAPHFEEARILKLAHFQQVHASS